jgi:hypothetical protein
MQTHPIDDINVEFDNKFWFLLIIILLNNFKLNILYKNKNLNVYFIYLYKL